MIVEVTALVTVVVVTVNVAVELPAATVTLAGTVALVELDVRATTAPPVPAVPLKVTVPVDEFPPTTDVGFTVTPVSVAGLIVSVAVLLVPARVAVIVAVVALETDVVLTVKVAVVAPAATVTVAGTVALVVLDERLTAVPPVPAGPLRVTVPVELLPPETVVGVSETLESAAGVTVRVAVCDVPARVPVIVTEVLVATPVVVIVNVVVVEPEGTVTDAGTVALVLLEVRVTVVLAPAGPLRVTVPVDGVPPVTEVGETVTLESVAGVTVRVAV